MPKTPARDDYFAQSFRFTPEQAATIKDEAKRLGSTTAFVRELIDDHRTMFGLPGIQVEVLEADMKEPQDPDAPGIRSASTRSQIPNAPRGTSHE